MKNIQTILERIPNKKMLVIFPHPDDETVMAGSLIRRSIRSGWKVKVVSLTEGGRGRVHVHGRGRSVVQMRREEFIKAMGILGVLDFEMWKEDDGKLSENDLWRIRVERLISSYNPEVVVTYDLSGVSGHPDHIVLGREILKLKRKMGFKLWWPVPKGKISERFSNPKVKKYLPDEDLSLVVDYGESLSKWRAVYSHLSQGMKKEFRWPIWIMAYLERVEWYAVAKSRKYKFKRIKFEI